MPDGAWLVEVPVVRAVPAPAYVLPEEAAKEEHLSRAVRVGRTHMIADFIFIGLFFPLQSWLLVAPQIGIFGGVEWWLAAMLCVLGVVMWRNLAAGREDERLRAWLQHVGKGAPLDAEPMETRRWARGWWGRSQGLKRCRPGWMVVGEAAAFCAIAASTTVSSFGFGMRYECRKALAAWWEAGASIASFPDGCFGVGGWYLLPIAGSFLALAAATSWD